MKLYKSMIPKKCVKIKQKPSSKIRTYTPAADKAHVKCSKEANVKITWFV